MIKGIARIFVAAPDLEGAASYFTGKLGLLPGETAPRPESGTISRTIPLAGSCLELVAVTDPTLAPPPLLAHLARHGNGLYNFSLASDKLDDTPNSTGPFLEKVDFNPKPLPAHPLGALSVREVLVASPSLEEGLRYFREGYGLEARFTTLPPWLTPFNSFDQALIPLETGSIRLVGKRPDTPAGKLTAAIAERGIHLFAVVLKVKNLTETRRWLDAQQLLPPPGDQNRPDYIWLDNKRGSGSTFFLTEQ